MVQASPPRVGGAILVSELIPRFPIRDKSASPEGGVSLKIDCHQHFWHYVPHEFEWIGTDLLQLRRDFYPADLEPWLRMAGVEGTICVQARESVAETERLLGWAEEYPFIRGVVGWVDLCGSRLDEELERFAANPKFRGVRHVLQSEGGSDLMRRPDFINGMRTLSRFSLSYDLLIFPRDLTIAFELARQVPEQRFVTDHMASPTYAAQDFSDWAMGMKKMGKLHNVFCKISDLGPEVNVGPEKGHDLKPYIDVVLESFGTKRILIGSDWPVCTIASEYPDVLALAGRCIEQLSESERDDAWTNNAIEFYSLPSDVKPNRQAST